MRGTRLKFEVPENWQEEKSSSWATAYRFRDKDFDIIFQIGVAPQNNDSTITSSVKDGLKKLIPGYLCDTAISVAGKKALRLEYSDIKYVDSRKLYVTTSVIAFFDKNQLFIFAFGSTKENEEDTQQNLQDLRLLYGHLAKAVVLL
jgi:hypothetical protein